MKGRKVIGACGFSHKNKKIGEGYLNVAFFVIKVFNSCEINDCIYFFFKILKKKILITLY